MKHIRKFSTEQEYTTWKSSSNYALPNICAIGGDTIESCEPRFNDYFHFEDHEVEAIVANWIGNGMGTTLEQIQNVQSLSSTAFKAKTAIRSFNELKFFTGLSSIPSNAFNGCTNLVSVKFPSSITTIGSSAFYKCTQLKSLDLYASTFAQQAFDKCTGLTSITIRLANTTTLGLNAFYNSPLLTNVYFIGTFAQLLNIIVAPNYNNYGCFNTVRNIWLNGEKLTRIVIPEGYTNIKKHIFENTTITYVEIPSTVTSIGANSFRKCTSLSAVIIKAESVPSFVSSYKPFANSKSSMKLYVPFSNDHSILDAYKNSGIWTSANIYELDENGNIPS